MQIKSRLGTRVLKHRLYSSSGIRIQHNAISCTDQIRRPSFGSTRVDAECWRPVDRNTTIQYRNRNQLPGIAMTDQRHTGSGVWLANENSVEIEIFRLKWRNTDVNTFRKRSACKIWTFGKFKCLEIVIIYFFQKSFFLHNIANTWRLPSIWIASVALIAPRHLQPCITVPKLNQSPGQLY